MIKVKNPTLKKKVFAKMNYYDKQAIKNYEVGNMKKGKYYESLSDKIYKDNYSKIFQIY